MFQHFIEVARLRKAALIVALVAVMVGCGYTGIMGGGMPRTTPGFKSMGSTLMVPVAGARVNAYGGNLFVGRTDMSLDTLIGEWKVGAVFNSATGAWLWNFNSKLRPARFGAEGAA